MPSRRDDHSKTTGSNDIGSCSAACEFLAAAIKNCKAARHLCPERQITASPYFGGIYLEQVLGALWRLWEETCSWWCK